MKLSIESWGTALPAHAIAQEDAARAAVGLNGLTAEQARLLPALYRRSGVRRRASVLLSETPGGQKTQNFFNPALTDHDRGPGTRARMAAYEREALPLALAACRQALASLPADRPTTITHLVTVSCSGFAAPGVDIGLIQELGLNPTVQRTHVGFMGCHGAINALRVAAAFAGSDARACILLCAVELCSLHYQYGWLPDQVVANALFADGAAAVVGVPATPDFSVAPDFDARPWRLAATGSCLLPASTDAMSWSIGDHGFVMTLAPRVPQLIGTHLRPWLTGWLAEQGLSLFDVRSWAIHPGGPRIVQAVEESLGLDPTAAAISRAVLAECGNMSSPTILFILERLARRRAPRPCLALAFGPGLTAEAALFV